MTNEEFVDLIRTGNNEKYLMEQLFIRNEAFINVMCKKYCGLAEFEDLKQECYFALHEAVQKYNNASGAFITYLSYCLKNKILYYLKNHNSSIRLPMYRYEELSLYKKVLMEFQQKNNKIPSIIEMSQLTRMSIDKILDIQKIIAIGKMRSLDAPIHNDGEDASLNDVIPGLEGVEDTIVENEFNAKLNMELRNSVNRLSNDQKQLIEMRYYQNNSRMEICQKLGVEYNSCANIERKALRELRKGSAGKELRKYMEDKFEAKLYRRGTEWNSVTECLAMQLYMSESRNENHGYK